ncbi:glutamyl-tRNA(Gln) amidotransferase subunit B, mitochondrial-like [Lineus longissimus]|uniref:glutamyl-tRNA(Gln) amidotransferase subunit B, mitochondrial-like n=1 Tax=Lineus longissimus TaxID=88925 RepID=UPI00315D5C26
MVVAGLFTIFRRTSCKLCVRPSLFALNRRISTKHKHEDEKKWESVVGIEVHAQISSKAKLFSGSGTEFAALINNRVAFLDVALPGTLPVLNKRCVEASVITGLALSCDINKVSKFDRKHYFYGDLPSGYQITQQRWPIANNGRVEYDVLKPGSKTPVRKSVTVTQLQMEQDSGKSIHDEEAKQVLIDLNRAGVGLMEIITAPEFSTGIEVAAFLKELQHILLAIGTCDGKMEEGSLRVDASVSIHHPGEPLGVRAEVKNINSIKNVAKAIDFEVKRQVAELEKGNTIENETRSFDAESGETVPMRDKERLHDYRFMPEPNLPPLRLYDNEEDVPEEEDKSQVVIINEMRRQMPELPEETRQRLSGQYAVSRQNIYILMNESGLLEFFEEVMKVRSGAAGAARDVRLVVNWIVNDLLGKLNELDRKISECNLTPAGFGELVDLLHSRKITNNIGLKVLSIMLECHPRDQKSPRDIVEENEWFAIHDEETIAKRCEEIIAANPKAVAQFKRGKKKVFKYFVGEVHKLTNNCTNPKLVNKILKEKLS